MSPAEFSRLVVIAARLVSPDAKVVEVQPWVGEMPAHVNGGRASAYIVQSAPRTFGVYYDPLWAKRGFYDGRRMALHEACHMALDDWSNPAKTVKQRKDEEKNADKCAAQWTDALKRGRRKIAKADAPKSKAAGFLAVLLLILI